MFVIVISVTEKDTMLVQQIKNSPPAAGKGLYYDSVIPEGKVNNSSATLNLREAAIYDAALMYPEYAVFYYRQSKVPKKPDEGGGFFRLFRKF